LDFNDIEAVITTSQEGRGRHYFNLHVLASFPQQRHFWIAIARVDDKCKSVGRMQLRFYHVHFAAQGETAEEQPAR
jgi:hypothetical protein